MISQQQYLSMERNSFGSMFLLFIILVSGELVRTQARMCYSRSRNFRGFCMFNHNCASVCLTEGFTFGYCTRWRHRCMCYKPCGGPPEFSPPFGETPPFGEMPLGFGPPEGMLRASQATSKSRRPSEEISPVEREAPGPSRSPEEMSPEEAPRPSFSVDMPLEELEARGPGPSEEMTPGEEAPAPEPSPTERIVVSPRTAPVPTERMSFGEPDPEEVLYSLQFEEPNEETPMPSPRRNRASSWPFFNFNDIN